MSRMRTFALALLPAAAMLTGAAAHAQARGPSAQEVQQTGQDVGSSARDWTPYLDELARETGIDREELASGLSWSPETGFVLQRGDEKIPLGMLGPPAPAALDAATRASKNLEHQAWLARLVGRFRLRGRVEKRGTVAIAIVGQRNEYAETTLGGDVSGIADCTAIGAGAGVHCFINATWPVIEPIPPGPALQAMMGPPPASERVMLFTPAAILLGLNPDTAEIRASMVTDDSFAHTWAGRLEANSLTARRITPCMDAQNLPRPPPPPCFQPLELVAEPGSGIVTMVHRAAGVTIKLAMQRDPAARAEKPMKTKKAR
jgi:hypothetical protein